MGLLHKIDTQKIDMTEEQYEKRKTQQENDTTKERHDNRQNDNRLSCCVGLLSHHDHLLYAFIRNIANCQQV